MCGIAGILRREETFNVGAKLLEMARCLQHRGADSAGVAIWEAPSDALRLQVSLPFADDFDLRALAEMSGGQLHGIEHETRGLLASINGFANGSNGASGNATALATRPTSALWRELEARVPGATVSSLGRRMRVHKCVGPVELLAPEIANLQGTHGLAHLRLATESKIDPAHAQPFWGRPFPDIAVTHNGHITNYHKLRNQFEARGFDFASHNDSEVIGVFLGDKMARGLSFGEALQAAGRELDGSYSFIAATSEQLGVARDPLATKPLLFVESEVGVTLASEPQALYHACGKDAKIREIKAKETRTWSL